MTRTYYEHRFCDDCIAFHWLEITRQDKEICHGKEFYPHSDPTHYTRRLGRGVEMIEKSYPLPLDWQMALELKERETIDQDQDW